VGAAHSTSRGAAGGQIQAAGVHMCGAGGNWRLAEEEAEEEEPAAGQQRRVNGQLVLVARFTSRVMS
jgi:hypothetical protein